MTTVDAIVDTDVEITVEGDVEAEATEATAMEISAGD